MHKDANLLQSIVLLNEGWVKYLLHRIGFVKQKGKMSIVHFEKFEVKKEHFLYIKLIISMDEIPEDLVINFN